MFTVVITEKGGTRQTLEFDEESVSIGRVQGNEVVLPRGNVSKRHAKLEFVENRFMLTDLGSTNGTYVNGRRVHSPTQIFKEDSIYLGDFILSLSDHVSLDKKSEDGSISISEPQLRNSDVLSSNKLKSTTRSPKIRPTRPPRPSVPSSSSPPRASAPARSKPNKRQSSLSLAERVQLGPMSRIVDEKKADSGPPSPGGELSDHDNEEFRQTIIDMATVAQPDDGNPTSVPRQSASPIVSSLDVISAKADESPSEIEEKLGNGSSSSSDFVETVVDHVARQIRRVDRARTPSRLDPGTAGRVRIVIDEYVEEMQRQGKVPSSICLHELKGKAFRAVVDLGPIAGWLDDPEVNKIRVIGPKSCFLLKALGWIEASSGFKSTEDVAESVRCLGAGLQVRDGDVPGISWYRLEEGYLAFTSNFVGTNFSPAVIIDKMSGIDAEGQVEIFPEEVQARIREAIDARAKIAVAGGSCPLRLAVISQIVSMLPEDDFVVTIEDLPFAQPFGEHNLRLSAAVRNNKNSNAPGISPLVEHALRVEPSWLVMSGTRLPDIPTVFSASASRDGVIAEVPFGAVGRLDKELSISMATCGVTMAGRDAALSLETSFDIIVIVDRSKDGNPLVARILSNGISKLGEWSPKTLYSPLGKS